MKAEVDASTEPFGLDFRSDSLFETGEGPRVKTARVILSTIRADRDQWPLLTNDCLSYGELAGQVQFLKQRLDAVLAVAKERFDGPEPS